jgi:hypothetical protein
VADNRVTIVLDVEGSAAVAKVFSDLAAKGKEFARNVSGGGDEAKKSLLDLGEAGKRVFEIFTGVSLGNIFVEAIQHVKDLTVEMLKLGRAARVQEESFRLVAESVGISAEAMEKGIRQASDGLVNFSDVALSASRALQQGLDPGQIVALTEIARAQAKLAGKDVTTAFNEITTATANQQLRALKSYGIIIDTSKAYQDYANKLGTVKDALTETGQSQAVASAVIETMRGKLITSTSEVIKQEEAVKRWAVAWEEGKEAVGKRMAELTFQVIDGTKEMRQALADSSWLKAATDNLNAYAKQWASFYAGVLQKLGVLNAPKPPSAGGAGTGPSSATMEGSAGSIGRSADQIDRLKEAMGQADQATALFTAKIAANRATNEAFAAQLQMSIDRLVALGNSADPAVVLKIEQLRGALLRISHDTFAKTLEDATITVKEQATLQLNAINEAIAKREKSEEEGAAERVALEADTAAKIRAIYFAAIPTGTADQIREFEKQSAATRLQEATAASKQRQELAAQETKHLKDELALRLIALEQFHAAELAMIQQMETANAGLAQRVASAQSARLERETSSQLSALRIRVAKGVETEQQAIKERLQIEQQYALEKEKLEIASAERSRVITIQAANDRLAAIANDIARQQKILEEDTANNPSKAAENKEKIKQLDKELSNAMSANANAVQTANETAALATQQAWEASDLAIQQASERAAEAAIAALQRAKDKADKIRGDLKVDNAGNLITIQRATGPGALIANNPLNFLGNPAAIQKAVENAKALAEAQQAWFDAMQAGQISFTQWQSGASMTLQQLTDTLSKLPKSAEEAAAALADAAKAAIENYESVRNAALALNAQLVGDLIRLGRGGAQAIQDQLAGLQQNVAFAKQQLDAAIAAKATAADQIHLEQNLRDAVIARYEFEVKAQQDAMQGLKDTLENFATPLATLREDIGALAITTQGNVGPMQDLEASLIAVANESTNTTVRLWAVTQGLAAVNSAAVATMQAMTQGRGPLAAGPDADMKAFVTSMYEAAAPFIAKIQTMANEAIDSGDIEGAVRLLQQEQQAVQTLAATAIKAMNDWATAAIQAVQDAADAQRKSVTAAAKSATEPLQQQVDLNKQIIDATKTRVDAEIKANQQTINAANKQIAAIEKVTALQEAANQKHIDSLNRQIDSIQKMADAQIKTNELQAGSLEKQIKAINDVAEARQAVNERELDALTVQQSALEDAVKTAEDWQHAVDSVTKQIQDLLLGPSAPLNPMAQLKIAQDAYKQALRTATTPEGITKAQGAADALIKALGTVYARPSTEFRAGTAQTIGFEQIIRDLQGLQATATVGRGPASLDDLNMQLASLNDRIKLLQDTNKEIAEQAKAQVAPLQEQVDTLKDLNATIKDTADAQIAPLKDAVDVLNQSNADLKASTDALLEPLQNDVQALQDLNATLQAAADSITGPLEAVSTQLSGQITAINAGRDQQLAAIDEATNTQIASINDVRDTQIAAINDGLGATLTNISDQMGPLVDSLVNASVATLDAATAIDLKTATQEATDALTELNTHILDLIGAMQAPPGTPSQPSPLPTPGQQVRDPSTGQLTTVPAAGVPVFTVPSPTSPSTTPSTGGTVTPTKFSSGPGAVFPRFQHGGIVPASGFAKVEEKEMVLPARIANYVVEAVQRGDTGGGGMQLSIAPGAIVISGVSDPEQAAAMTLEKVEDSVRTGRLSRIIQSKPR